MWLFKRKPKETPEQQVERIRRIKDPAKRLAAIIKFDGARITPGGGIHFTGRWLAHQPMKYSAEELREWFEERHKGGDSG